MGRPAVLKIDILSDGKQARSDFSRTGKAAGKLGTAMKAGAALGVAAVGALAFEAIKSASATEQALGASEKVFGKFADSVQAKATKAANAVGLSKSDYLDLANVIGTQLKNAGTPMDQLAGKTDKLVNQAADMAAVFGGSTADAVAALSSAMKGELDPIERYGVSIKKSDVNARLAAKGLDKLEGNALKAAEQQALLGLINEQTADSTGAFADEANTAAGVGQRSAAVWENVKSTLGAGLLPVVVALGTFFLETLAPAAARVAQWFSSNVQPAFERTGSVVTGRLVPAAKMLWTWFQEKIYPSLRNSVQPIIEAVGRRFVALQGAIERNRPAIDKVLRVLRVVAEFIAQKVAPVVGKLLGGAFDVTTVAIVGIIDTIGWLIDKISSAVSWFQRLIDKIGAVASKVSNSGIGKFLGSVGSALFGSASPAQLVGARMTAPAGLTGAAGGASLGLVPSVNVAAPNVSVFIGEREVTGLVRVEVANERRKQARRQLLMPAGR